MTPRQLYKYGRIDEHTEHLFSTASIWFAPPLALNDLAECRPEFTFDGTDAQFMELFVGGAHANSPNISPTEARTRAAKALNAGCHKDIDWLAKLEESILDTLARGIGIYCLSRVPDSLLMWSHYAQQHCGFCLIFDASVHAPFAQAQPIIYSDNYPVVDFFNTPNEQQVDQIFLTKYLGWSYEQEERIIDFNEGSGLRTYNAPLLRGIIFGARMSGGTRATSLEWLTRRGHSIEPFQAVHSRNQYGVRIEKIDR